MRRLSSLIIQAVILFLAPTFVILAENKTALKSIDSTNEESDSNNDLPSDEYSHIADVISRGVTQFTLDLDKTIESVRVEKGVLSHLNLIFSPSSLTSTLATILLGSNGQTFDEVAKVLGLETLDIAEHSERIHKIYGEMVKAPGIENVTRPLYAYGTFIQKNFVVRDEFKEASKDIYGTEVVNLDFEKHGEAAKTVINKWVNDKTMGKIKAIISETPSPDTRIVFASALYFCGEWRQHFFERGTKRKLFTIEPSINKTVHVDMMYNGGKFPFHEDKELGIKILGFPYKNSNVTMYVLLPNATGVSGLQSMKKKLTVNVIDNLLSNMKIRECIIGFPSMKLSSTFNLRHSLELLGITSLFDPNKADLRILASGNAQKKAGDSLDEDDTSKITFVPSTDEAIPTEHDDTKINKEDSHTTEEMSHSINEIFEENEQTLQDEPYKPINEIEKTNQDDQSWIWRPTGIKLSFLYSWMDSIGLWRRLEKTVTISAEKQRLKRQTSQDSKKVKPLPKENHGIDKLRSEGHLDNPSIFADDVLHKVEITVNEKGTEAAASTVVVMNRSGDYKNFMADRPFLFFIRDNDSKLILFWGSINTPVPNYT